MSAFWSRILISAAGIPLVLWLVYLGGWPMFGLAAVGALIALHELYWMTRTLRPVVLAGYLGALVALLGATLGGADWALAGLMSTLLFAFVMLFVCFEVFCFAMIAVLAQWLLETLAWWTIVAANLLAALAMLGYLLRQHRVAWRAFLSTP